MIVTWAIVGLGCLLLILGAFLILKAYRSLPDEKAVVPRLTYESIEKKIEKLKAEGENLAGEVQSARAQIKELTEALEVQKKKEAQIIQEWDQDKLSRQQMIRSHEEELIAKQNLLDDLQGKQSRFDEERQSLEAKVREWQALAEEFSTKMVSQAQEASEVIELLSKGKDVQDGQFKAATNKLDKVTAELAKLKTEKESMDALLEEKNVHMRKLEQQLGSLQEHYEQQLDGIRRELQSFKEHQTFAVQKGIQESQEAAQVQAELASALQAIEKWQEKEQLWQSRIQGQEIQIKEFQEKLETSQNSLHDLGHQLAEFSQKYQNLKIRNEELESRSFQEEKRAQEQARIQETVTQLSKEKKALEEELRKAQSQAMGLEQICSDFKSKVESVVEVEDQLSRARKMLALLERENSLLKKIHKISPAAQQT